jgi:hypothetical protein
MRQGAVQTRCFLKGFYCNKETHRSIISCPALQDNKGGRMRQVTDKDRLIKKQALRQDLLATGTRGR